MYKKLTIKVIRFIKLFKSVAALFLCSSVSFCCLKVHQLCGKQKEATLSQQNALLATKHITSGMADLIELTEY